MRSRRKLGLGLLGALGVILLVTCWPVDQGPVQNGKSLSAWLLLISRKGPNEPGAREAILAQGTNSLPYLVAWIPEAEQGSFAHQCARWLCQKMPRLHRFSMLRDRIYNDPKQRRANAVVQAFGILGPSAAPAIPDLERMVNEQTPAGWIAMEALVWIGPPATSSLQNFLQSTNWLIRYNATMQSRIFGTNAVPLLPSLTQQLSDTNEVIATAAAWSLSALQLEPDLTVPALASALQDTRPRVRSAAVTGLQRFHEEAHPAVPALLDALQDSDPSFRELVTNALRAIKPDVFRPAGASNAWERSH